MSAVPLSTLDRFNLPDGSVGCFYSLPALGEALGVNIRRLPLSIRIVLESVLRHCDDRKIGMQHVMQLAHWQPAAERVEEIPFIVSRVVLQDNTGVPLLVDLAAMRSTALRLGKDPRKVEPGVPVDMVVDHSVRIDHHREENALDLNMALEFARNNERYQFMKWGMQAFDNFHVIPPGFGIIHQINLEYLACGVHRSKGKHGVDIYYPDTVIGTDSHTPMINGLGIVGWGVGGIEAEASMLGQPLYFLTPDVIGVHLTGRLPAGCTATDLALTVTEMLRKEKVVGKFVEFFGEGVSTLTATDRATVSNMAPEYGPTMALFPIDDATLAYFSATGRSEDEIAAFASYFKAQQMFGIPHPGDIDYTKVLHLDLGTVVPSMAGPRRPQDRIALGEVKSSFEGLLRTSASANGFNKTGEDLDTEYVTSDGISVRHGDILIAAITSCTNTSNPELMLAAGLLAKKAVEAGLTVAPHIKTSLAPGSRLVTEYLKDAGLLPYLEQLGFRVAAYGCTTCIGNTGQLPATLDALVESDDIVACAVLSGNRNFEARIHPRIRANFLASPPLVVAYALAGTFRRDLSTDPIGEGKNGKSVYLADIWPSSDDIGRLRKFIARPASFRDNYASIKAMPGKRWEKINGVTAGDVYDWTRSTYIAEPPFFQGFAMRPESATVDVRQARALGIFGDSVTTDHISPAGPIEASSPAAQWLRTNGVTQEDFNSYGARRGNHEVMVRGTFANVLLKNLMIPPRADQSRVEGGYTLHQPSRRLMTIYDAAMAYLRDGVPALVFGGEEYGTGSSRDWAAKGMRLLGVKAVIARSFERIHRSNLVGMGVLPLQFVGKDSVQALDITGNERFDLLLADGELGPRQNVRLVIHRANGQRQETMLLLRLDTPIEVEYFRHGGILPFVLRQLLEAG